jgi:hemolysin activation/secretion protein
MLFSICNSKSFGAANFYKLMTILLGSSALWSQSVAHPSPSQETDAASRNTQELLRRQQQEQQLRKESEGVPNVRLSHERLKTPELPDETPCFEIQRLEIKSMANEQLADFDWVLEQLSVSQGQGFMGQCIGAQGVAWVTEQTQKILIDRGLVTTRVLTHQQDISKGTLVLTLIPGRIRAIRFSDPVDPRANLSGAFPMQTGDLLNLRDIEQALENFKRVPTAKADIQIEPSQGDDAQFGDSDLVVTYRQKFPLRLSWIADDSGTKATGRNQGSLRVSFDNPLTVNDLFYVINTNSLGDGYSGPRGNHATTIHYSVPFGYWTLDATASTGSYYQTVAGSSQNYVYQGINDNKEIKLNRLWFRDEKQKVNLAVRAFQRKSNNYIDDTEVNVQRRVVGGWDGSINHKIFLQDTKLETKLTYRRGTGAFGSIPAPEEASNNGTSRFVLMVAETNVSMPFKLDDQRIRYDSSWRYQVNGTTLTPQDRFVIGGRYSVRGYDGESVLSAERGWFWRNEWSLALSDSSQEFYAGLDTGQVGGPSSDLLVATKLTGAVMGLRGAIHNLQYDLFIGKPIHKPDNFNTASSAVGFSLSASF